MAVFKNISGPESEKIKKDFQKIFKDQNLEIVVQCNMKTVDYLDVTLDLTTGTYKPYHKENNEINYVHAHSNHPPNIIKQIPLSIQTRLSNLSSDQDIFNQSTHYYAEALKRSGYNHEFKYTPKPTNTTTRNRKRKIIWFNPPYNINLATNIGKFFLNLINKHFPRTHKFHKLFNKNNVKVSYSCMPNIKSIINSHNKRILTPNQNDPAQKTCNCTRKDTCPLQEHCLSTSLIYEATLKSDSNNEKKYIGLCQDTFKKRYNNHKTSLNLERYRNNTTLSTEFWKLKEDQKNPTITWKIIRHANAYTPETNKCSLCLNEKYEIANYQGRNMLNKRTEIIAKCRHKRKYELAQCSPG